MSLNLIFRKPKNELEKGGRNPALPKETDFEMSKKCPACGNNIPLSELWENGHVCPCGHCFRMNSRQRISFITQGGGFTELYADIESVDFLKFP